MQLDLAKRLRTCMGLALATVALLAACGGGDEAAQAPTSTLASDESASSSTLRIGDEPTPTPQPSRTPLPGLGDNAFVDPDYGWSISWNENWSAEDNQGNFALRGDSAYFWAKILTPEDSFAYKSDRSLTNAESCLPDPDETITVGFFQDTTKQLRKLQYGTNGEPLRSIDPIDSWMVIEEFSQADYGYVDPNAGIHYVRCIVIEPEAALLFIDISFGSEEAFNSSFSEAQKVLDTLIIP